MNDADLSAALEALVEGQISGVASVSQNGETVTFRGPSEIERQIKMIEAEIQRLDDIAAGVTRRKSWVTYASGGKGWV